MKEMKSKTQESHDYKRQLGLQKRREHKQDHTDVGQG